MGANQIRSLRQARGMSPTELAFKIGRSTGALWQYESGTTSPPLHVARLIARALGEPLDVVFPDQSSEPGPVAA